MLCLWEPLEREPGINGAPSTLKVLSGFARGRESGATLADNPPVVFVEGAVGNEGLHPFAEGIHVATSLFPCDAGFIEPPAFFMNVVYHCAIDYQVILGNPLRIIGLRINAPAISVRNGHISNFTVREIRKSVTHDGRRF